MMVVVRLRIARFSTLKASTLLRSTKTGVDNMLDPPCCGKRATSSVYTLCVSYIGYGLWVVGYELWIMDYGWVIGGRGFFTLFRYWPLLNE